MIELRDLYQEVILDHNRSPRNFHIMEDATASAEGYNPLCGDKLSLYLKVDNRTIADISFVGCGCAISTASASLMTESLKGKTVEEAVELFEKFHSLLTEENALPDNLGKLAALSGVRTFPSRVKCATLAWHTLQAALSHSSQTVSTE